MAFGFLGRRRRGPRRDRGGPAVPPGASPPDARDQKARAERPPDKPPEKMRRAARDVQAGQEDTEARWRAAEDFAANARGPSEKRGPTVIVRRRHRI